MCVFRRSSLTVLAGVLSLAAALPGCSRATNLNNEDPPITANLQKIGEAYQQATNKLNRPPQTIKDLQPHLKDRGDVNALAQLYVILWGVDYRSYELGDPPMVIAYERESSGGKRWVFAADGISQMTTQALAKAKFPPVSARHSDRARTELDPKATSSVYKSVVLL